MFPAASLTMIVGAVASGSPAVPDATVASAASDAGGGGAVLSLHARATTRAATAGRTWFPLITLANIHLSNFEPHDVSFY
jgi:hypothetical protein